MHTCTRAYIHTYIHTYIRIPHTRYDRKIIEDTVMRDASSVCSTSPAWGWRRALGSRDRNGTSRCRCVPKQGCRSCTRKRRAPAARDSTNRPSCPRSRTRTTQQVTCSTDQGLPAAPRTSILRAACDARANSAMGDAILQPQRLAIVDGERDH